MKKIKKAMYLFILSLVLSTTSCQDKYSDLDDGLYAEIVTNKGTMLAKLYYKEAPVTVANFVALAEGTHPEVTDSLKGKKYYEGIIFHRVIDKFMIQTGDPTGTGSGGPGYKFPDEFHPNLKHDKPGVLSMANSGPKTNGSQFFITEVPTPHLDGKHSVFGELVKGIEVQDTISNVKVASSKPIEDVVIQKVIIIRKGKDAKNFDAVKVYQEELPLIEERQKKLKEEALAKQKEAAKAAAQNFSTKNKGFGRLVESPTGLVMYIKDANGKKPTSQQKVLIDYAGYFEDGTLFDTSSATIAKANDKYNEQRDKQGQYKPFPMIYNETARLVPGFKEAMLNMKVGDRAKVFIPSYLAYGERGAGNVIPPNANLIFELEIIGIQK